MSGADRIPPPEIIYVVAGSFQAAQYFIRRTGEDPKVFKIVLHPENLRGLATGARVVVIMNEFEGRRWDDWINWLSYYGASVRYVDLDQMTGTQL